MRQLSLSRKATTAVLHTRAWTKGSPVNPNNNHPIRVANIVGVHNGGVWNDDELFAELGILDRRIGHVDSEAIFAALAYGGEPYGKGNVTRIPGWRSHLDALEVIEGTAAIAWLDTNDNPGVLHVARIASSPLAWAQTKNGSFIFASTLEAIRNATRSCGLELAYEDYADEGDYFRIEEGRVAEVLTFEPARSYGRYSSAYGWSSFGDTTTTKKATTSVVNVSKATTELTQEGQRLTEVLGDEDWTWDDNDGFTGCDRSTGEKFATPYSDSGWADPWNPFKFLTVDTEAYYDAYEDRETAIDAYMNNLRTTSSAWYQAMVDMHGFARPGTWVRTKVMGQEVIGQVWELPRTFPEGMYEIRVLLSTQGVGQREVAWVRRHWSAFKELTEEEADKAIRAMVQGRQLASR